jgi:hypothetical protein
MIEFNENKYFDDRIFVLYLCKGTVKIEPNDDGAVWTTIYHESPPSDHIWCVVTYKNIQIYPIYRVDSFHNKEDAIAYIKQIEPETPLISLGGKSPENPMQYDEYVEWKKKNNLQDYNWKSLYSAGGINASEIIGETKKQFKGIK